MYIADLLVWLLIGYAAFGGAFALAFVSLGVDHLDATAKTIGFRLTIFPGVVALWPLLLSRWLFGPGVEG